MCIEKKKTMLPIYKRLHNYLMMPVIALNICHFDEANLADHLGLHQTLNLHEYYYKITSAINIRIYTYKPHHLLAHQLGEHMVQETLKKL